MHRGLTMIPYSKVLSFRKAQTCFGFSLIYSYLCTQMDKKRTLVVDDEQNLCETLQHNLTAAGYEVARALCIMLAWMVGSTSLCAQEIVEHQGNHYTIHADALEPDTEMTLLDVLQICPEFMTIDGKSITADYVLTIDDISIGVNWEGMLQNIKAIELDEIHIYNYSTVANGDDGITGEINITFKDAELRDAKIALAGSTYGNGRLYASYAESGEKVSVRGMLNTELRYGKGSINEATCMTSRRGIENASVFLNWQPTKRDKLEFKLVQGYLDQANRYFVDGDVEKETTRERLGEFSATYERELNDRGAYLYLEGGIDFVTMEEGPLDMQTWAPIWNIETRFPLFTDHLTITSGWEIDYINYRTKTIDREQYLNNDLYLQFDYNQGPWLFTIGDRLRLIHFWDKNEANTEIGEQQFSHHRNDHALHASVGYKTGRHFMQGTLGRNFYIPTVSDFFQMDEHTNLRLYSTDFDNNHVWQVEARYAYQTPKLVTSASLLHQWMKYTSASNEQMTGIRASVTWHHGRLRLTAGADYYHQQVDEGIYSVGFHDNFYHLKLVPTLTLHAGWRLSSVLLYSSRRKQYDEHSWLYASLKVNKDLGRYCNVFADFHDIAGSPTAFLSDLNGYYKNRALTIGATIYPFRK